MKAARAKTLGTIAVGLLLAAGAALLLRESPTATPLELPATDLSRSEPQVVAAIDTARRNLLENGPSAARWATLAQVLHAHDFHAPAAICYREAAALAPRDWRWPYLAALAVAKADPQAAEVLYDDAAALAPDEAAFYINRGDLLLLLDHVAKAKDQYDRALEMDADSSYALHGLARIAMLRGDLSRAHSLLERTRVLAPREASGHILRAQLLARMGKQEDSKRAEQLAQSAGTPGRAYDSVVDAMEALAVSSSARAERGALLARRGDFEAAEHEFREVLEIRSGYSRDHANLGGALARQGKTLEAIKQFRLAEKLAPDDAELLSNFGFVLADAGDPHGGIERLQKSLTIDGTRYETHHCLALVLERQGDMDRALVHYREALRLNPGATDTANDFGRALARQGHVDEAVAVWVPALQAVPDDLAIRYNLALARIAQGRHDKAIALLTEGCRQAPRSSRFLSLLAWERATAPDDALRDGAEALILARKLHAAAPDSPEAADMLAAAQAEAGLFAAAVRTLEAVLVGPKRPAPDQAKGLEERLALYRARRPYRQPRSR